MRVARHKGRGVFAGLDQGCRPGRQLSERADHFRVTAVTDQHDFAPATMMQLRLAVDFGDQRAGGVQDQKSTVLGILQYRFGHTVGRQHHGGIAGSHGVEILDEDRAPSLETFDHVLVVDNLVTHVDRGPIGCERTLDDFDRTHDARAKAARGAQQHPKRRPVIS